jgi:hypothetical protein
MKAVGPMRLHAYNSPSRPLNLHRGAILPIGGAALIAWLPIVRIGNLVKDGAKRRRLRRSSILDKIADANRNAVQAIKAAF